MGVISKLTPSFVYPKLLYVLTVHGVLHGVSQGADILIVPARGELLLTARLDGLVAIAKSPHQRMICQDANCCQINGRWGTMKA